MKDFEPVTWTYASPTGDSDTVSSHYVNRKSRCDSYTLVSPHTLNLSTADRFPDWEKARFWTLSKPKSGQKDSFAHHIVTIEPNGGSTSPEPSFTAEGVILVVSGEVVVSIEDKTAGLADGGFCYIPSGSVWAMANISEEPAVIHWIRKTYISTEMDDAPAAAFGQDIDLIESSLGEDSFSDAVLVDANNTANDISATIVTVKSSKPVDQAEILPNEHGVYVLQGAAIAKVNGEELSLEAGDYLNINAFCTHQIGANGTEPLRYLSYRSANRAAALGI